MKFEIEAGELLRVASFATSVISPRNTMPVLAYCLIESLKDENEGLLQISATNLDQSIRVNARAKVVRPGAVVISPTFLNSYCKTLPATAPVTVEVDSETGKATLKVRGGRYTTPTIPAHDFPVIPAGVQESSAPDGVWPQPVEMDIEAGELRRMLSMAAAARATEEIRSLLIGVLCEWKPSHDNQKAGFLMVATCTHRLTKIVADDECVQRISDFKPHGDAQIVIPPQALPRLSHLLGSCKADEIVTVKTNGVLFEASAREGQPNSAMLLSRVLEGTYPRHEKVIPQLGIGLCVPLEALAQSLQRLALVGDSDNKVAFKLEKGGSAEAKTLHIYGKSATDYAEDEIAATPQPRSSSDSSAEWEFEWAMNAGYVDDFLRVSKSVLGAEKVLIYARDTDGAFGSIALNPFTLKVMVPGADGLDVLDNLTHIIMPLQV